MRPWKLLLLKAAQAEAAAEESLRLTTAKELKKVTSVLKKVDKVASDHAPWVRRPSTQPTQFVDEPRVMVVLRGALPDDLCDSVRGDLVEQKGWMPQAGDKINAGRADSRRLIFN